MSTLLYIAGIIIVGGIFAYYIYTFLKVGGRSGMADLPSAKLPQRTGVESRQHPRTHVNWPVSMDTPDGTVDAEVNNISLGGAFISCEKPLPVGHIFSLTLICPDNEPITATAQVVWSNANMPEKSVINRGMGVRFIKMSERHLQIVRGLFKKEEAPVAKGQQR
jgi:uncharacterized protein (TIGR02266 family)